MWKVEDNFRDMGEGTAGGLRHRLSRSHQTAARSGCRPAVTRGGKKGLVEPRLVSELAPRDLCAYAEKWRNWILRISPKWFGVRSVDHSWRPSAIPELVD